MAKQCLLSVYITYQNCIGLVPIGREIFIHQLLEQNSNRLLIDNWILEIWHLKNAGINQASLRKHFFEKAKNKKVFNNVRKILLSLLAYLPANLFLSKSE